MLDRLVRAQYIDWDSRNSEEIARLLSTVGYPASPDSIACFGDDHLLPGHALDQVALGLRALHRAGQIRGGDFNQYWIFARAYLNHLAVPVYGRSPRDVLRR